jgi:hypothetical protein
MIDFSALTFKRAAAHRIMKKEPGADHGIAELDDKLLHITTEVIDLIKERLVKSVGRTAKAFVLEIGDSSYGTFFDMCYNLKTVGDNEFLKMTGDIALHLAKAQTSTSYPGGYLIFLEAYTDEGKSVYIAIKAELHDTLRYEYTYESSRLHLLDDVFLSPSQKLYKIGVIYELDYENMKISKEKPFPNNEFGCFLYDDQFNPDSKPAEYFYKDFLGFSIDNNPKIQSKKFYENTEDFIIYNIDELGRKKELLNALRHEFTDNTEERRLKPHDFAAAYFNDEELTENYFSQVAAYLPQNITKDTSLIKSNLEWRKVNFPNKVNVSSPAATFDINIQIVESQEDLDALNLEGNYTIVKILGKPFQGG